MRNKNKEITENNNTITLNNYKEHVGEWFCSTCATEGSGQPAKIAQTLRGMGYDFEERSTNVWAKQLYCEKCGKVRSHYKLLSTEPVFDEKLRCTIPPSQRKRIKKLLGDIDAFTNSKSTTKLEIDHKIPFARLNQDIDVSLLTDDEIKEHFQLLTRQNNLLKDRRCQKCIKTGKRPKFNDSIFYYKGDENYKTHDDGSHPCVGCGYHDGIKWQKEYNNYTQYQNTLIGALKRYVKYQCEQYNDETDDE